MQRRDRIIFNKIISETDICTQMLENISLEKFLADEKLKRACAMTVINIGELVKNLTDETRLKYNHISWKAIAGIRDIVLLMLIKRCEWKMFIILLSWTCLN